MLTYAFVQSAIDMYDVDYGYTVLFGIGGTFVLGIGSLAFGVLLMFLWFFFPRAKPFFRGESLNRETPVLVPEDPAEYTRSIDGGSDCRRLTSELASRQRSPRRPTAAIRSPMQTASRVPGRERQPSASSATPAPGRAPSRRRR